jgi:hypothetical protein
MKRQTISIPEDSIPAYNRDTYDVHEEMTKMGKGNIGGKATGLVFIKNYITNTIKTPSFPDMEITTPAFSIITTQYFDQFMDQNNLYDIALEDLPDTRITHAFMQAEIPPELVGNLRSLISKVHVPLAIRSSSLLEDAMFEPFAGIYGTKMLPNNQFSVDERFQKLTEAIKFVWASTFFCQSKNYFKQIKQDIRKEKMAIIIQEVVGKRYEDYFYPIISGVFKSYNFYPTTPSKPEDGVINLALGLGKTIVDGGISWIYSPLRPKAPAPFKNISDMLNNSQTNFWAIQMGKLPVYDPLKETEYLEKLPLEVSERHHTLHFLASTYDSENNRFVPSIRTTGPRFLNFAPILSLNRIPLNQAILEIRRITEELLEVDVEIEFALSCDSSGKFSRLGILQVRPMVISQEIIEVPDQMLTRNMVLVNSANTMGNGKITGITDIVYVKPGSFDLKKTPEIAGELSQINKMLLEANRNCILIGFGRWGSSDPWLGIPVEWGQINSAKVIVEAHLPDFRVEMSQGSHFFHNITNLGVLFISEDRQSTYKIDWEWLNKCDVIQETNYCKHIWCSKAITTLVDGKTRRGVIFK